MISFDKFFDMDPEVEYFAEYDCGGISTLTYKGADFKGKLTRVFAHMGFPEDAKRPVPAVVLIHGGGGHPDDNWIKRWNDHGYAAIAMFTNGYFLERSVCLHKYVSSDAMLHGLILHFYKEGYVEG